MAACLFCYVPTPLPECHKCIPKHGKIHPIPSENLLQCYLEFILSRHNAHLGEEVGNKRKFSQPSLSQRGGGCFKANHQQNTAHTDWDALWEAVMRLSPFPCPSTPSTAVTAPQCIAESVTAGCVVAWLLSPISSYQNVPSVIFPADQNVFCKVRKVSLLVTVCNMMNTDQTRQTPELK